MAKYPRSKFLDKYSNWHWDIKKGDDLFCADVDGFFVESRKREGVVAVYDIKEPDAVITMTEKVVMNKFIDTGWRFFIIWPDWDMRYFKVFEYYKNCLIRNPKHPDHLYWILNPEAEKTVQLFDEAEYINFLAHL